ncbi:hypothetical protein LJB90_01120 [Eubacteriales bacterium OttesenSCG-928-G02]|nr:hypothetical protein [Eubacteriales bacterium OttesenSCG-928-G02]
MLYPALLEKKELQVNRYGLVIATAKGARAITEEAIKEREEIELRRENDRFSKDSKAEFTPDSVNDKAVSKSIKKIYDGDYTIVLPTEND